MEKQKNVENIIKENLLYHQEIKKLKAQEKFLNNQIKVRIQNCYVFTKVVLINALALKRKNILPCT